MSDTSTKPTAASFDEWVDAATHYPLLPSGKRVGIRIPDLALMVETDEIPNHLIDAALGVVQGGGDQTPSRDLIVKQREFTDLLVKATVVEPKLTDDQVKKVPFEDKELLVAFATRQRDVDAQGDHLAGLEKSEKFRRFRRLGEFDEDVEGL